MAENNEKKNVVDSLKTVAKKLSDKTVNVTNDINDFIVKKKLEKYLPIYENDLQQDNFKHERLIRVVNYDTKHDKELCKGAVGFYDKTPSRKIPTIYTKFIDKLGLYFYPNLSESVYSRSVQREYLY